MIELEVYKKSDFYEDYISSQKEYYERENADAYFAERLAEKDEEISKLKAANKLLKEHISNGDVSRITWIDETIELKQKLEDVQSSMYAEMVDANMENRRLKHSLYNLRACYADMMQKRYIESKTDGWVHRVNKWIEVERKCLKKAVEYK